MNHTSITLVIEEEVCSYVLSHIFFAWEVLEGLYSRAQKLGVETTIMMDLGGPLLLRC